MGVKEVSFEEIFKRKSSIKCTLLKADIAKIIREKIPCSELIDFPYSIKSMNSAVWVAQNTAISEFFKLAGKRPDRNKLPIHLYKNIDNDGQPHVYCYFNINEWDSLIAEAKEKSKNK